MVAANQRAEITPPLIMQVMQCIYAVMRLCAYNRQQISLLDKRLVRLEED